jgi:carboxypeptidase family protein/TonB-dependent receptor-like protein
MKKLLVFLFAALLVAIGATSAFAQRLDGTLSGVVTDPQGGVIPDAKVTATNEATGVVLTSVTTSAGVYVLPSVPVGAYTVTVEKGGFEKYVRKGVQVYANQVTEAHAKLVVGAATTIVEVSAGAEVVQTTTSQISNDFGSSAVTLLPNTDLGGSPLNLALLAPGTTAQGGGVLGEGGSVGGTRPRFNQFTIDGVDNSDPGVTGPIQPVIQDAVEEFNLVTNQFTAELGHSAGGQFNIITKSGTNAVHGNAFVYNVNRNYNAMDNLEKEAGLTQPRRLDFSRAGGSAGGPILRDKWFIFGSYQRQWEGLASSAVIQNGPTAAGLAQLQSLAATPAALAVINQMPLAPAADPVATANNVVTNSTTCPAPAGCPIPFGPASLAAPNFFNQHDFLINSDFVVRKHRVAVHFLYDRFRAPDVNLDTPQSQFTGTNTFDARKVLVKDAWSISDRFLNDFRASYSRSTFALLVPPQFRNFPNAEIDVDGLNIGPEGNAPQSAATNVYQLSDSMTYARGKHVWKWGGEYRHWIVPSNFLPRDRGEYDYATINDLVNDFVPQGLNGALRGAGSGFFAGNQNAAYLFVQDDFKVNTRLTVNLGVRYEWNGVPRDSSLQNLNSVANLPGVFTFGTPKADYNDVAPRVGFALDPLGNGKWAVRGGFGITYDVTPQNFPLLSLPPQLQTEQFPTLTCSLPSPPAWCANFLAGGPGAGFLAGGGLSQVNVPPTDQLSARGATGGIILDVTSPKVLTWTLGVQHELLPNTSVEVRYLGTHSTSLLVQDRLNVETAFDAGLQALPTFFSASQVPASFPTTAPHRSDFTTFRNNGFNCVPGGFLVHAADGFCDFVTGFPPLGNGIYHALSVDFNHRVGHGLMLRANYTFSRNIDNATNELFSSRVDPRRAEDTNNIKNERGLSVLDVPHKLALSWVYDLPKIQSVSGFVKGFLHGWQWSGTYLAYSGQPITILSGTDSNANGDSAGDRAILNPSGTGNTGTGVTNICVDSSGTTQPIGSSCSGSLVVGYVANDPTARFVQAQRGAKSNIGRNTFRAPGVNVWNMTFGKTTKVTERYSIQFRADAFDIFNHRNFALQPPSVFQLGSNALSTSYSNVTAGNLFLNAHQFGGGSRQLQLVLKFLF